MNTNELVSLDDLLNEVSAIVDKYDRQIEESGERFNIFNILGVSSNEVKLHSRLLAELLSPKGSHGMGDKFLKFFLEALPKNEGAEFTQTQGAIVEIEKWLGTIDNENDKGGYIDLLLRFPDKNEIIIENKIYAGDQEGQLRRYYNYNPKAKLIYLTLDGKEASDFSTKNTHYPYVGENVPYLSLSYMSDVKSWLEKCLKLTDSRPKVQEIITQYVYVINQLIGKGMDDKMQDRIVETILANGNSVKAAFAIEQAAKAARNNMLYGFGKKIRDRIKLLDDELRIDLSKDFGVTNSGILVQIPKIADAYAYFGFSGYVQWTYLEIGNPNDSKEGKNLNNIEFYLNKINTVKMGLDSPEDTLNGWRGEWVCRYDRKWLTWVNDDDFWPNLAEDNFDNWINEIVQDMMIMLDAIRSKTKEK